MITHLAVVPTTPLLLPDLPGAPHPDMARLAAAARRVTAGMVDVDVVIAIAGGPVLQVVDAPDADLTGYGVADLPAHPLARAPDEVIAALREVLDSAGPGGAIGASGSYGDRAARSRSGEGAGTSDSAGPTSAIGASGSYGDRAARSQPGERTPSGGSSGSDLLGDAAGPDLAVLARHVPAGVPCVGLVVPAMTDDTTTSALAQTILQIDGRVAVVAAGDLSAGHGPKPPRPTAAGVSTIVDEQIIAALDNGRPRDLMRLDLALADQSAARAIGALRVVGAIADAAKTATVVRASGAPLGVGYVVAQGG